MESKLVCGCHGLEMGCDGKTVAMPGQRVRGFPPIRAFPVIERYGFIWVWPGDAEQADPAKLHQLEWAESPEWAYGGGLYHINCDYRLMVDNLMDLTHETYVHSTSIGQKEIDETPTTTRTEGDMVVTSRHMENIMAPPFWRMALRDNHMADDVPVDRWQICRFTPPSHVLIEVVDTLTISAPRNHFPLAHEAAHSLLLAGGIGVTPILCMAERLAIAGASFEMHYATRSRERTAFHDRIVQSGFAPRVQFHFDDGDAAQKLQLASLLATPQAGTHLYVCGPKGFVDAVLATAPSPRR